MLDSDFGFLQRNQWTKERDMIQLNIVALTELTKLLLPGMIARKSGKILNVASTAAFQPGPLMRFITPQSLRPVFLRSDCEELKGTGVTVTALCPGPTQSGFQKQAEMENSKLFKGTLDTSASVARQGYAALQSGKRVVVTGLMNKIMAQSIRFRPCQTRFWVPSRFWS